MALSAALALSLATVASNFMEHLPAADRSAEWVLDTRRRRPTLAGMTRAGNVFSVIHGDRTRTNSLPVGALRNFQGIASIRS